MARIVFHLTLKSLAKQKEIELTIDEPISLLGFLEDRQIPADQVGLVIRNGRWANKYDCMIESDDHIQLFPFLQGG